jgi:hypothetical protein
VNPIVVRIKYAAEARASLPLCYHPEGPSLRVRSSTLWFKDLRRGMNILLYLLKRPYSV